MAPGVRRAATDAATVGQAWRLAIKRARKAPQRLARGRICSKGGGHQISWRRGVPPSESFADGRTAQGAIPLGVNNAAFSPPSSVSAQQHTFGRFTTAHARFAGTPVARTIYRFPIKLFFAVVRLDVHGFDGFSPLNFA